VLAKAMNLPADPKFRKEDWNDTLRTRDIIRYPKD